MDIFNYFLVPKGFDNYLLKNITPQEITDILTISQFDEVKKELPFFNDFNKDKATDFVINQIRGCQLKSVFCLAILTK